VAKATGKAKQKTETAPRRVRISSGKFPEIGNGQLRGFASGADIRTFARMCE
jgi:hypothetical protein